jgi:hypothetical protein
MSDIPLHRGHVVTGEFSLEGARLTFETLNPLLVHDARQALAKSWDFTVTLHPPEGPKAVTGRVTNVGLVTHGEKPQRWHVAMLVGND